MTEEEIKKKKKEALVDYNLARSDLKKSNNKILKRIFICVLILGVIGIFVRVFYGRVYISNSVLRFNKSIEYKMYINGSHETVGFEDSEDSPIIPGLLYFRRTNKGTWYNLNKLNEDLIFEEDKIELDFVVSECYTHTDEVRVSCDSDNGKLLRKKVKPKFNKLFIRKNGKNEKVMYDGKFISDISSYVKEKGYYYIEIYAEYDGIDTKLYLFPERKVSV